MTCLYCGRTVKHVEILVTKDFFLRKLCLVVQKELKAKWEN